jgi:hypothetical protein
MFAKIIYYNLDKVQYFFLNYKKAQLILNPSTHEKTTNLPVLWNVLGE